MTSKLALYILNSENGVAPFPSEAEQIVLYDFTFEAQRMGAAPEITATIQAPGSLENYLTTKVFCEYNGERYFLKNLPSSLKENTDPRYTFDLTFVSERTILDNVYMIDAVQGDSSINRYQSNSTNIVFMGTIEEFIARLNASMIYTGVGYSVVLDEGIVTESKLVSFQDKVFTEALQEGVKIFNIPYYCVGKIIHFGYSHTTIPTLKYGDGLLSINKSIRTERIVNRATATGSTENIPYYYPNPTPKGFINPSITDKSGAGISVINEAKLSRLGEGEKLAYYEFPEVEVIGTYFSEDYNAVIPPYVPVFDWEKKNVKSGNLQRFNMSYLISGLSVKSTKDETMDVFINFYLSYASSAAKYIEFKDVIAYVKEGDALIIDTSLHPKISGGGILIPDFPTNAERYIAVIYYNNSYNTYRFDFNFSSNYYLSSGWYISDGNDRINDSEVNIFDYGVSVSNTPKEGDEVSYKVIKKIPFATSLMPPIYRETDGAQIFYNAINGAYEGVTFENEYSEVNPKEAITKFETKPTIVGVTNANGERIDMFAEFAYDLNDSDETELTAEGSESFIHPYFYAKLRKIDGNNGFNLFAQAIESGEMTIELTSGHCGACKFVIAVDENTQRNLVMVDNNGDLIYDEATGKVQMANDATGLDRQNDTLNYEVWIALKKDISTYGHIIPIANSTIQPSVDDTFVITNILLPQAYFYAAEKKLEDEIIAFLVKNNAFQFDYGINFSRIFLKKRNDVFSKLTENSIIPIEYNGNKLSFYVSSYTYRKQKGEVLPEISVSLTDNFDSSPSAFQQSISAIQENIVKGIGAVGLTFEDTDPRYLRKDVADTVKERTTFEKGLDFGGSLTSRGFKKGNLIGAGFGVYEDEGGNTVVEADKMVIRKDAQFSEVVINQTTFQLGATVFSGGGCNITDVEEVEGAYRCYYDNKSGTRFSGFVVGDQARCQRFDESFGGVIKYYWRLVVAVGTDYVDLSKTDVDGGGIPESGDDIVNFGNRIDKSRQNAIVINPLNGGSVEVYAGINSFSLEDKNYVGMGVNPNTSEAYMYGYGNIYIGDRDVKANDANYVTFQKREGDDKRKLFISADVKLGSGSTGLSNISEFNEVKQTADNAVAAAKSYTDEVVGKIQDQLDGKVESFFYDYDPTTTNLPASEWTTDELKEEHLNDTFTNTDSGKSWRWLLKDGEYQWVEIADTQASEALAMAQTALGVANGKVAVFVSEPRAPYNEKDLWVQGENGRIKRCITTQNTVGVFYSEDWVNADDSHEYTDSKIAEYKKTVDDTVSSLNQAIEDAEDASRNYTDEGKRALQASIDALNIAKANIEDVYDKATADGKISQAEQDAIKAAQDLADAARELAEATAAAYADGEISEAEQRLIEEAEENLNTAKKYAEDKAKKAEESAKKYSDDQFNTVKYLKDAFGSASVLDVDGITLSALVGVKDNIGENAKLVAGLYGGASSTLNAKGYKDATHGTMLLFGGIEGADKPKSYKTAIFEDGYLESTMFATGRTGKRIEISGNELNVYGATKNDGVLSITYDGNRPTLKYTKGDDTVGWFLSDTGISTSYTVYEADKTFIALDGDQEVIGLKTFTKGAKFGSVLIKESQDGTIHIDGNVVLSGGLAMYGTTGTVATSIFDALPIDNDTIYWEGGVLKAKGGTSGGGIDEAFLSQYLTDNKYATQNWVEGNYLSQSGGTITGNNGSCTPLKIKNSLSEVWIGFTNPKGSVFIGASEGVPSVYLGTGQNQAILHSGNIGDYALPLTGGVMSGYIAWNTGSDGNDIADWNAVRGNGLKIISSSSDNSNAPYTYSTGLHIKGRYGFQIAAAGGEVDYLYFKNVSREGREWKQIAFLTDNVASATKLQTPRTIWGQSFDGSENVNGALDIFSKRPITDTIDANACSIMHGASKAGYTGYHNGIGFCALRYSTFINHIHSWIGLGGHTTIESAECYPLVFATNGSPIINTAPTEKMRIMPDGNVGIGTISPSEKLDVNGNVKATKFIGNLTGNADTATKLATPRTIWGQEFDGTGNIGGNLTPDVSGTYTLGNTDKQWYAVYSIRLHSKPGSDLYIGANNENNLLITKTGNVGIGTLKPSTKLHVDGDATFSSKVIIGDIPIYKSQDGVVYIDGSLVLKGGLAMYGSSETVMPLSDMDDRIATIEEQIAQLQAELNLLKTA